MKKLLLSLTIVFSMGLMTVMAQDCASFIRYYDQNVSFGMISGNPSGGNATNPLVEGVNNSTSPSGDTIVCAGNVLNMGPGFDWIPSIRIEVPDAAVDSYLIAWKTDQFGSGGSRGGISGGATTLPVKIFLDDIEGCFVEVLVPYPDEYFAGSVAMVQRNTCSFDDKAIRAEEAGAEAIVIFNRPTEPATALVYMGGDADTINIDCWFTSSRQGIDIVNEIDLEEREVLFTLCDRRATDANWTKDGAAYTDPSQSGAEVCSDGPGMYRIADFTLDLGCGPISLLTDSTNHLIGPAPCGGQASCNVGIADDILNEKVNIYPNPTTGLINLTIGERVETEVSVYTITGQKVINETTHNQELISMDLSKLDSGIYLVKIKQGDAIATKRVNVLK